MSLLVRLWYQALVNLEFQICYDRWLVSCDVKIDGSKLVTIEANDDITRPIYSVSLVPPLLQCYIVHTYCDVISTIMLLKVPY